LRTKFDALAVPVLGKRQAAAVADAALAIDELDDSRALLRLLRPDSGEPR